MADASGVGAVDSGVAYVSQLHEVYRLSDALHRTSTLDTFCELAVDGVLKATGASRAAILLLDAANVMRFRAWRSLSDGYRAAVEGHNPWRLGDRDPLPVLVPDVRVDPSLQGLLTVVRGEGIGALAFVPITCDGVLAGKFMVYHDAPHDFGAAEVEIACAVAHHVGFALERKQAENRLRDERQLFVDGPVVVFKWRAGQGWPIEFVSANVAVLTGYSQADWLAGRIGFKSLIHPDDLARVRDDVWRHNVEGVDHFGQEYRIVRADGGLRWVRDFTRTIRDEGGVTTHFHGYLQDVTGLKAAEDKLRDLTTTLESRVIERTSALQEACRELEAFTYSVSHDLRAPLRSIDSYAALLRESAGDTLDPESVAMFGKIRAATQRMTLLIDDLLALSRISQQAIVRRRVDISQIANDVAGALRERDPERSAEWVIEPGLAAQADPGLVRLLLENLLDNAWKFTGRSQDVRISVCARRDGDVTRFEVRDNGAGFDMRYVANLFAPFQRLHSADQFPGSGIGLATVSRIVRRHGGEIAAHAAPGQGASFVFSLEPVPAPAGSASR